jgi:predicted dehydrogenase
VSEGVKVAQIGCGHWGKNLARNFADLGALAAISDDHPETAARIAAEHGVPARSFAEILADPAIDGIALATPAAMHGRMALEALAAGKHVFVEKPLALDPAEAEAVVAAAESAGRVLMIGHLLQYHPQFRALLALVREGRIGRLRYIYSNRLSLGKIRTEENVLWSFAPHDISMVLALTGGQPEEVTATGAAILQPGIADWSICHLNFPSGVRAHLHSAWLHPFKEHRLVVVGDNGMAVFEDSAPEWERRLAVYPHRVDFSGPAPAAIKGEPDYVAVEPAEPLRSECSQFLHSIATAEPAPTDGREGLAVLRVLDRAEQALRQSLSETGR